MTCSCGSVPARTDGPRRLLLAAHFEHTRRKIDAALAAANARFAREDDAFDVATQSAALEPILAELERALTPAEQDATRALVLDAQAAPGLSAYLRADSLARLIAHERGRWLVDALGSCDRTSYFQPIRDANGPRVFAHEALLRVKRDGAYVGPGEAFRSAGDHAQFLDRIARETAIAQAAHAGLTTTLFVNFLPSAIYDPRTCLTTTIRAVDEHAISHDRVVFEVVESERIHDVRHLRTIADYCRSRGFRFALDDLGAGYASFTLVNELRPDFVKLDMALVRDVDRDPYKAVLAARLIDAASDLGIATIVEGIEREEELQWAAAHGADYVQGFLVGPPSGLEV